MPTYRQTNKPFSLPGLFFRGFIFFAIASAGRNQAEHKNQITGGSAVGVRELLGDPGDASSIISPVSICDNTIGIENSTVNINVDSTNSDTDVTVNENSCQIDTNTGNLPEGGEKDSAQSSLSPQKGGNTQDTVLSVVIPVAGAALAYLLTACTIRRQVNKRLSGTELNKIVSAELVRHFNMKDCLGRFSEVELQSLTTTCVEILKEIQQQMMENGGISLDPYRSLDSKSATESVISGFTTGAEKGGIATPSTCCGMFSRRQVTSDSFSNERVRQAIIKEVLEKIGKGEGVQLTRLDTDDSIPPPPPPCP